MAQSPVFPDTRINASEHDPRVHVELADLIALKYKARNFSFLPHQPVHSVLSGRHGSRLRGRGLNFEEIRVYRPGDDVRMIDWKVTARMREAHTRVFTEERDRPVLFIIDQRISMFFGTRLYMKSVSAAHAAALGAWRVLDVGDRVGAIIFNDDRIEMVRPHRSRSTVTRILEHVVSMNAQLKADAAIAENPEMLNRALDAANKLVGHDYLVTVISDFAGNNDVSRQLLRRFAEHNDVLCILIHDPSATDLPPGRNMRVTDGQLQMELEMGSKKIRKEVNDFTRGRIEDVFRYRTELDISVLPISTDEDVAIQVQRLLGSQPAR
ncbi:MAG: hypothetical protein DHS20C01_08740 [marine bacterium B5-7]|nr:MAG: hypothetical protein DHS20C01_08740 [marine bacterium B5-7]